MTAPVRCRHCGAILLAEAPADGVPPELRDSLDQLSRRATVYAAILRVLTRRFGEEVLASSLMNAVYGRYDWPLTGQRTLHAHISRLRHMLRPLGLVIASSRLPCGYRLERLP